MIFKYPQSTLILALILTALSAQPAFAANIEVTSNADDTLANLSGNSTCDLREAITAANTDTTVDACTHTGTDTITFAGEYSITLDLALPQISTTMTIDGTGQTVTVSGASSYRVFDITSAGNLTINNLSIADGNATQGAGIYNSGTLAVSNCTFSGNNASSGGGGIYNYRGTITAIANSTFNNNEGTGEGGGIHNYGGTITAIANSTFSQNSSPSGDGGAINNYTDYGTPDYIATITNIVNSTFFGNSDGFGGGGIYNYGTISAITNSTFSGNSSTSGSGGGICNNDTITTIANSIIANSPSGGNCYNVPTGTKNLSDDNTCGFAGGGGSDLDSGINLGSLADNDGPTKTIALLSNSSAIDAGDATTCSNTPVSGLDQRGVNRPQGSACDIGAFEHEVSTGTLTVTKTADTDDGVCKSDCSLREAIASAGSGATITFSTSGTITLGSALPQIATTITIDGSGQTITVDGADTYRVFDVTASGNLTVNNLTVANGDAGFGNSGGGFYNAGILTITNSTISNNTAGCGGGVHITGTGALTISNSTFTGNTATSFCPGGAILVDGGTVTITNSTISGNSASFVIGGINNGSGVLTVANTIIANNTPSNCGGTIIDGDRNLEYSGTSCGFGGVFATGTDDPLLGPLAANGGPTQTMALQAGSPALDAGDANTCASSPVNGLDQRGVSRPQGANCDIGAYELEVFPWPMFLPAVTSGAQK